MKMILTPNKSKFLFLASLLLVLAPTNSFASDSLTYSIAARMIDATEHFTLSLFDSIAAAYKPLYINIATIGLIVILTKYLFTRVAPIREMLSFSIAMMLSSAVAFDTDIFQVVVYDTFFDTLYRFNQFVIQTSTVNMPAVSGESFNSLEGLFKTVDSGLMGISNFAGDVASDNKSWVSNIPVLLESWIIYLLYLFVSTYFLIIFTVSIFGAHMMIVLMPITISLYPFKRCRHYSINCINGMFHYGLVTVFACVAISLVLFIANDLVVEANQLREEAAFSGEKLTIPAGFLTASLMVGFLSIFFIKISTEFASRVLNSATSQLGGAFPMVIAGATTVVRGSATIAKTSAAVATPAVAFAANKIRKGK
jgi:hypothetical protein